MSVYKPGTVAMVRVKGSDGELKALRMGSGGRRDWWVSNERTRTVIEDADVTNVRPLVVLELGHPTLTVKVLRQVGDYIREMKMGGQSVEDDQIADFLADQIEAQTKPSRIDEPTSPLAEVEASTARRSRRRFIRGWTTPNSGARWVDGVAGYAWSELVDPLLVRDEVGS